MKRAAALAGAASAILEKIMLQKLPGQKFAKATPWTVENPRCPAGVFRALEKVILCLALGIAIGISLALPAAIATPAAAQPVTLDKEIRNALTQWMDDFNAGRADKVCDIFAPTLRADVDGFPNERGFDEQCRLLKAALADREQTLSYALDIKEILANGDMAAVRLVWTLTSKKKAGGETKVDEEQGLDIFGRGSDGQWKIIRFMSYERN